MHQELILYLQQRFFRKMFLNLKLFLELYFLIKYFFHKLHNLTLRMHKYFICKRIYCLTNIELIGNAINMQDVPRLMFYNGFFNSSEPVEKSDWFRTFYSTSKYFIG